MTDKEKLEKIKQLADAMYNRMQNLTTDTSGIRKAMDDYRHFIIFQYSKEEPVSEDLEEAAIEVFKQIVDSDKNNFLEIFKAGAQWQKEQMMKDAIEVSVEIDAGGYPYINRTIDMYDYDNDQPLAKKGDKVKVIIIKSE